MADKKCPDCSKKYPATKTGHTNFIKHWYREHYKPKKKAAAKTKWARPKTGKR